jgi:DNA-binding response OmpR family regulator
VVDADPATQNLLEEWLTEQGCHVLSRRSEENARPQDQETSVDGFDLALVDVPFPRQGLAQLERVAQAHPRMPIVAMSSTFFASVECTGALARMLGVAGVLPKPLKHDALIGALRTLLCRR